MLGIIHHLKTFNLRRRDHNLILVYDGLDQLNVNPFTHQLFISLKENFNLSLVQTQKLVSHSVKAEVGQTVLVISRLRKWRSLPGKSHEFFRRSKVFFYDQDPWEAYHDNAACRGIYEKIFQTIRPEAFLVTSPWWAEYIRQHSKLPVHFVRMGILPKYCDQGDSFAKRAYKVGFQGTVHPHRMSFYDRLREHGIKVDILPKKPFFSFLKDVQNIGIFIYGDQGAIKMNGTRQPFHGLWGKCLTVAGRGCFVIRNHDLAYDGYAINELPTVQTFKEDAEIPGLIRNIVNRSDAKNDILIAQTISKLKERNDWQSVSSFMQDSRF